MNKNGFVCLCEYVFVFVFFFFTKKNNLSLSLFILLQFFLHDVSGINVCAFAVFTSNVILIFASFSIFFLAWIYYLCYWTRISRTVGTYPMKLRSITHAVLVLTLTCSSTYYCFAQMKKSRRWSKKMLTEMSLKQVFIKKSINETKIGFK